MISDYTIPTNLILDIQNTARISCLKYEFTLNIIGIVTCKISQCCRILQFLQRFQPHCTKCKIQIINFYTRFLPILFQKHMSTITNFISTIFYKVL